MDQQTELFQGLHTRCQGMTKDLANIKTVFPFLFDEFGFKIIDCLEQKRGEFRRLLARSAIFSILFYIDLEKLGVYVGTSNTSIDWQGIDLTNPNQFWIGLEQLTDYLAGKNLAPEQVLHQSRISESEYRQWQSDLLKNNYFRIQNIFSDSTYLNNFMRDFNIWRLQNDRLFREYLKNESERINPYI